MTLNLAHLGAPSPRPTPSAGSGSRRRALKKKYGGAARMEAIGAREALEEMNPGREVLSDTVPRSTDKGMTFQNKSGEEAMRDGDPSPVVGAPHPETWRLYDRRGEPNLDGVTRATVEIEDPATNDRHRTSDKRKAIKALQKMLKDNPQMRARYKRQDQRDAIDAGGPDIPEHAWDHERKRGRMRSVDREDHEDNGAIGPFGFRNTNRRRPKDGR